MQAHRLQHLSSDEDLLTFAIAARGPGVTAPAVLEHDWRLARDLGARISVHVGMRITGMHIHAVEELHRADLMGPDDHPRAATVSGLARSGEPYALRAGRLFDGHALRGPTTLVVDGGRIASV